VNFWEGFIQPNKLIDSHRIKLLVIGRRRGSKEMHKETLMMNQGEHLKKKKKEEKSW